MMRFLAALTALAFVFGAAPAYAMDFNFDTPVSHSAAQPTGYATAFDFSAAIPKSVRVALQPSQISAPMILAVNSAPVFHGNVISDASQNQSGGSGTTGPVVVAQPTAVPTLQPGNPYVNSYIMGDGVLNGIWNTCNSCAVGGFPNGHYHVLWENLLGDAQGPGDVAVGPAALNDGDTSTTGWNTAVGQAPMEGGSGTGNCAAVAVAGYYNTAIGGYAMRCMESGYDNTALGVTSLYDITTGHDNVGSGYQAGYNITTGYNNVILGVSAGLNVTTDYENVLVGANAGKNQTGLQGSTFVGFDAGLANTTGAGNTFLGHFAGKSETTGGNNTFLGNAAGNTATTATDNTFVGYSSGLAATGSGNTSLGSNAGKNTTTGQFNIDIGKNAGSETTGSQNVSIGYNGALPDATASGQLNIQNAIYGSGNTGSNTTLSTGCVAFYATTCTAGTVGSAVPIVSSGNSGQITCALSASTSCTASANIGHGFHQCVVSLDYTTAGAQNQFYPLLGKYTDPNVFGYVQTTTALTGTIVIDYVCT